MYEQQLPMYPFKALKCDIVESFFTDLIMKYLDMFRNQRSGLRFSVLSWLPQRWLHRKWRFYHLHILLFRKSLQQPYGWPGSRDLLWWKLLFPGNPPEHFLLSIDFCGVCKCICTFYELTMHLWRIIPYSSHTCHL